MFALSDYGWVVGHNWMIYGPLLRSASTIIYEGKPFTPDIGAIWRICKQYSAKSLFMAPTALRLMKKEDPEGNFIKKYYPDKLDNMNLAGERSDPESILWARRQLPTVQLNDTWW